MDGGWLSGRLYAGCGMDDGIAGEFKISGRSTKLKISTRVVCIKAHLSVSLSLSFPAVGIWVLVLAVYYMRF